jgi:PadR family transcriptional regulator, regulatory protein AphA
VLRKWQAQPPEIIQVHDELLLKVLFGAFASPEDLAQNLRASIADHEMRLLAYRQNALFLPIKGMFQQGNKRPDPYGTEDQEDPYFSLIVHFAIEFEKTYIRWLYEALEVVENR